VGLKPKLLWGAVRRIQTCEQQCCSYIWSYQGPCHYHFTWLSATSNDPTCTTHTVCPLWLFLGWSTLEGDITTVLWYVGAVSTVPHPRGLESWYHHCDKLVVSVLKIVKVLSSGMWSFVIYQICTNVWCGQHSLSSTLKIETVPAAIFVNTY
jgi:hypothetical protein